MHTFPRYSQLQLLKSWMASVYGRTIITAPLTAIHTRVQEKTWLYYCLPTIRPLIIFCVWSSSSYDTFFSVTGKILWEPFSLCSVPSSLVTLHWKESHFTARPKTLNVFLSRLPWDTFSWKLLFLPSMLLITLHLWSPRMCNKVMQS